MNKNNSMHPYKTVSGKDEEGREGKRVKREGNTASKHTARMTRSSPSTAVITLI